MLRRLLLLDFLFVRLKLEERVIIFGIPHLFILISGPFII